MSIRLTCSCGAAVVAADHAAGKHAQCPACGAALNVPPVGKMEAPPRTTDIPVRPASVRSDRNVQPTAGKHVQPTPIPDRASAAAAGNRWAKIAIGAGVGLVAVALVAIVAALSRQSSGEDGNPSGPLEPVTLLKPTLLEKQPNLQSPPVPLPKKDAAPQAQPLPPVQKPVTPPPVEQKEEPRIIRKFIDDPTSRIPSEVLTVAEAKIPYKVRRLKLPEQAARKLKLAVSPSGSDNIGEVLKRLGMPFDDIVPETIASIDRLKAYDVVFMNCGGGMMGPALRGYVEQGGTLYASDLQFANVLQTFPEVSGTTFSLGGIPQKLTAKVVDAGLRDFLGVSEIELNFNAPGWMPALVQRDKVTVYMEGTPNLGGLFNLPQGLFPKGLQQPQPPPQPLIPKNQPKFPPKKTAPPPPKEKAPPTQPNPFFPPGFQLPNVKLPGGKEAADMFKAKLNGPVPLLVRFRHKEGTVIFTSFHNNAQANNLEKKLLNYLVFSAVTAKAESKVNDIMLGAGFAPQNLNHVQLAADKPTPVQTYAHQSGGLQVAVGFENLGAKLKLTLTAPNGQKIEHEETGTFLMEVPAAPAGDWRYSVSPLAVPFDNFPIVVAVGKSQE